MLKSGTRYDWSVEEIMGLFALPFNDLIFRAQQTHRAHFDANEVQLSTLLSIKTGGCQEDCKYCPQSSHHSTMVESELLMKKEEVMKAARIAKEKGATRFCMGAAWREPKGRAFDLVLDMIREVKAMDMEACATLGMLNEEQARKLSDAGLDYYNHNLDTDPEYYKEIITTRTYEERLDTLKNVRSEGMSVCCGGIVGMGETIKNRAGMIAQLARMNPHPESVPINMLVKVEGTPLQDVADLDHFDFIRTIAVARITMPASHVRLSAGREEMNDEMQALCFLAGANSIFYGEKLLTTGNKDAENDQALFARLGLRPEERSTPSSRRMANA
ncbi:MAG: biotin synthase BioB [Zetaproteobacteria bacterium CG12_big_fil_rev_8_21_14_0_65_55_1124]|nr:MAG: biotin synthase BioB [Zetaproteobacteria bacterium CG1_02_55_237]PIS19548.1 MAG: biotin synthase BioB [Zetaproteobacteria bacterium CG08_land_8_20_14_0_20_55_17]PIW42351.1 MAG: biotin synthase BioB [Zetaproteobacteria bacterium CG12_big_fil_rev_8_21_14_0_65_55_1124]PIY52848.1 MAG: biotin synthase BioB [Zetaproteobacteria bacterium CG_4_10_14_0_8_um_filter_55_43]PIZ38054.1 MAG: biotin synthase BioB [Zetaproteobacteria bacterium CG_4_10_14_0_2_um_filter_55_20]PJB79151.1 MAG: biotin synth